MIVVKRRASVPGLLAPCNYKKRYNDYGEKRLITLGLLAGRTVLIAHAPRGNDVTRIISMRKANRREQKIYQERLGENRSHEG